MGYFLRDHFTVILKVYRQKENKKIVLTMNSQKVKWKGNSYLIQAQI